MKDLYEISIAFYEVEGRIKDILTMLEILENCNEEKDWNAVISVVTYYLKGIGTEMQYWCEQCDRCQLHLRKGV